MFFVHEAGITSLCTQLEHLAWKTRTFGFSHARSKKEP